MKLRPLVARPCTLPVPSPLTAKQLPPTSWEWQRHHDELERLYVRQRRKLRWIKQYMEKTYGFRASDQMYKKRFTQWGFHKNSKRSPPAEVVRSNFDSPNTIINYGYFERKYCPSPDPFLIVDDHTALSFKILQGVQNWSTAFFESSLLDDRWKASMSWHHRAKETSLAFKLVSNLLQRGCGALAGKVARRAFLLVEDLLLYDAPALLWNLLEVMHHMLSLGHGQLFRILLGHLVVLVNTRLSKTHPLATILCDLQRLVLSVGPSTNYASPLSSSTNSTPSSPGSSESTDDINAISQTLSIAWTANAETMFKRFDPSLLPLFVSLHWESCSVDMPLAVTSAASKWVNHIESQLDLGIPFDDDYCVSDQDPLSPADLHALDHLPIDTIETTPSLGFSMLREITNRTLREHSDQVLSRLHAPHTIRTQALRALPTLIKGKYGGQVFPTGDQDIESVSRREAEAQAWALKTLMDLQDNDSSGDYMQQADPYSIQRLQWLVALRRHAFGDKDLQVMNDMCLLADALRAGGQSTEMEALERTLFEKLVAFTQDVN